MGSSFIFFHLTNFYDERFSMPDITDRKKEKIRILADKYCTFLSKIPFEEGVLLYSKTYQKLFMRSARWRICLLCGKISHPEGFLDYDHKCSSLSSYDFPILVKTSWMKLEDFFLPETSLEILKERKLNPEK